MAAGRRASLLTGDSWLAVVRPHLGAALVDGAAVRRLRALARHLPGTGIHVIEARLGEEVRAVDLSLGLTDPAQAAALREQLTPLHLKSFLHRWADSRELATVTSVWLEFDLDLADEPWRPPTPVVCAKLRERCEPDWLVETLLPALHGRPLRPAQAQLARRCAAAVPAAGRVLYAFSLLSRPGAAVRLELYGLDPPAMVEYLGAVAPTLAAQVAAVAPLVAGCDRYHLSLDVGDEISPRIGVEAGFVRLPHREPRWTRLVDRLVGDGLCTAEQRDALFAWPGYDTRLTAPEVWPGGDEPAPGYCVRCLSHVKLVTWLDREPEAKAYLLFQHLAQRPGKSRVWLNKGEDVTEAPMDERNPIHPTEERVAPQERQGPDDEADFQLETEELEDVAGGWSGGPESDD